MSESILRSVASQVFRNQLSQSVDGWVGLESTRGETIAKLREYIEGEHDAKLTTYMRKALRIGTFADASTGHAPWSTSTTTGGISTFDEMHANHMGIIVQTMADRLTLESITADNDAASEYAQNIIEQQRLDGFQSEVHDATIGDGDTFVMVDWDTDELRWTHEPAYDGVSGMVVLYANRKMLLAIKMWHVIEDTNDGSDICYINVYYDDHFEKFTATQGGTPRPRVDEDNPGDYEGMEHAYKWLAKDGTPLGIPVIHFKNRARKYGTHGRSEISDAIPIQNAHNRTIYSMVMTAEMTAFQKYVARGFPPPAGIAPGDIIEISPNRPLKPDEIADMIALPQGDIVPYIEEARHLKSEMYDVTNTPQRDDVSSNASGERMKQQEIGLLGKLKRFQTKAGSAWEDVMVMSFKVAAAFSNDAVPAHERFQAQWGEVELRNDVDVLKEAREDFKANLIDHRTYLEIVAPIRGWDKTKIDEIEQAVRAQKQQNFADLGGSLPGFGQFGANGNSGLQIPETANALP
jgi:hypothetical protein